MRQICMRYHLLYKKFIRIGIWHVLHIWGTAFDKTYIIHNQRKKNVFFFCYININQWVNTVF